MALEVEAVLDEHVVQGANGEEPRWLRGRDVADGSQVRYHVAAADDGVGCHRRCGVPRSGLREPDRALDIAVCSDFGHMHGATAE